MLCNPYHCACCAHNPHPNILDDTHAICTSLLYMQSINQHIHSLLYSHIPFPSSTSTLPISTQHHQHRLVRAHAAHTQTTRHGAPPYKVGPGARRYHLPTGGCYGTITEATAFGPHKAAGEDTLTLAINMHLVVFLVVLFVGTYRVGHVVMVVVVVVVVRVGVEECTGFALLTRCICGGGC